MNETQTDRAAWLAAAPVRNPEQEQALFSGDVPAAAGLALEEINPLNPHLFRENRWQDHFARLRREDPVHFNELGSAGRYWSVTKWEDVRAIDGDWKTFSSANGITVGPPVGTARPQTTQLMAFIAMDPPEHTEQRKTVRGISAPSSLRNLEPLIPGAHDQCARFPPRGRDVRLGRHRVDRADHLDAGDPVRLPTEGSAQAHPMVRRRHYSSFVKGYTHLPVQVIRR